MKDSSESLPLFSDSQAATDEKRRKARLRKRESRAKKGDTKAITIELPTAVYIELAELGKRESQGGRNLWARALLRGVVFAANAGSGKRVKLAELPAISAELARLES